MSVKVLKELKSQLKNPRNIQFFNVSRTDLEVLMSYIEELENESRFLGCLQAIGVDSWEGYDVAREMFQEGYD